MGSALALIQSSVFLDEADIHETERMSLAISIPNSSTSIYILSYILPIYTTCRIEHRRSGLCDCFIYFHPPPQLYFSEGFLFFQTHADLGATHHSIGSARDVG